MDTRVRNDSNGTFFRHRWWNHYERGLGFAEKRIYDEALSDLKEAARQRSTDQRMARTYGMHFIDYFPHRETGVLYFETGDLDKALKELELSLSQYPSAKARYYLDQVRKKLIETGRIKKSTREIELVVYEDEVWTREELVPVKGIVRSDLFVSEVTIAGMRLHLEGAQEEIQVEKILKLRQGHHDIKISATDLSGRVSSRSIKIHVDREGPVIVIERIEDAGGIGGNQIQLQGRIYDDSGLHRLEINGQVTPVGGKKAASFRHVINVEDESIVLSAMDRLGNLTSEQIPRSVWAAEKKSPILVASLEGNRALSRPLAANTVGDKFPPHISLKGWTTSQSVYLPRIYLEGHVVDNKKVTSITINGLPILKYEGRLVIFSHIIDLQEGENIIRIEASDADGNEVDHSIIIVSKTPEAFNLNNRHKITVLPFDQKGGISETGSLFQDLLIGALFEQNRFQVVERNLLEVVLQEQKLSQTQLVDRRTALKVGQIVAAQSILTGSMVATRNGVEIISRLIDTETSEILATEDAFGPFQELHDLKFLAEGIAIKYHMNFPLVSGLVIDKRGKFITTDLGREEIKCQRRILVYQEKKIVHPKSGMELGFEKEIVGFARLIQVEKDMSKAELIDSNNEHIQVLYNVITE